MATKKAEKKTFRVTDDQFTHLYVGIYQTRKHIRDARGAAEAAQVLADLGVDWELMEAESTYPFDAQHAMPGAVNATFEAIRAALNSAAQLQDVWDGIAEANGLNNDKPQAALCATARHALTKG